MFCKDPCGRRAEAGSIARRDEDRRAGQSAHVARARGKSANHLPTGCPRDHIASPCRSAHGVGAAPPSPPRSGAGVCSEPRLSPELSRDVPPPRPRAVPAEASGLCFLTLGGPRPRPPPRDQTDPGTSTSPPLSSRQCPRRVQSRVSEPTPGRGRPWGAGWPAGRERPSRTPARPLSSPQVPAEAALAASWRS